MPIKVDKSAKIQKISDLTKKKSERSEIRKVAYAKYIFILILIGLGALCYQYRAVFYDYLYKKAKQLSENVSGKVTMTDVKYDISIGNLLTVSGNVFNYDERTIAKVNGVKISIFDDKSLVFSWDEKFEELRILPQQNVPFSTSKQLPGDIKGMRVEVSIF